MERRHTDRRVNARRSGDRRLELGHRGLGGPPWLRRRLVLLLLVALLLVPLASGALLRSGLFQKTQIPAELIGTWETSARNYADRALEFTQTSVILYSDAYHFTVHHILMVQRSPRGLYIQYHLEYEDRDGPTPLDLRYMAAQEPLIRLEHIATVWRRTSPL